MEGRTNGTIQARRRGKTANTKAQSRKYFFDSTSKGVGQLGQIDETKNEGKKMMSNPPAPHESIAEGS